MVIHQHGRHHNSQLIFGRSRSKVKLKMSGIKKILKWGQPLRDIMMDYAEVSKDIMQGFRTRPAKSIFWLVCSGIIIGFQKRCPSLNSYRNEVIEYSNELGLCAEAARNNQTKLYIDRVSTLLINGHVQHVNLGVCSLLLLRPQSVNCLNYHSTCKHLKPPIWTFHQRIVDVGVWNQWVLLNRKMVDFDVNESEFM